MKIASFIPFAAAVVLGAGTTARAAHVWEDPNAWWDAHWEYRAANAPLFTANELSLDMFGSYLAGEDKLSHLFQHNIRHGVWGGGVGVNYFITRELGVGGDINIPDDGGKFVDSMAGNLIARFPIESAGLAPYIFGGGTRVTQPEWQWAGQAGVGLEVRLNPVTGIFVDGRYMWLDKTPDQLELRAGMRFVF